MVKILPPTIFWFHSKRVEKAGIEKLGRILGVYPGETSLGVSLSDATNRKVIPFGGSLHINPDAPKESVKHIASKILEVHRDAPLYGIVIAKALLKIHADNPVDILVDNMKQTQMLRSLYVTFWNDDLSTKSVKSFIDPLPLEPNISKDFINEMASADFLQACLDFGSSEQPLVKMSIASIEEFYRAADEDKVVRRIRELNSPSFLPEMLWIWVNYAFLRKESDADLLAHLLVGLTKSRAVLDTKQLIKGFELVLTTLEDEFGDGPKVFLGRIFARLVMENIIALGKIKQLVRCGGSHPGHLVKIKLGAVVGDSMFELIKKEKGETGLADICCATKTCLEDFSNE